jgi:FtsX extracellular domain
MTMQTDELRAELRELANEEDRFNGDLPAIRRRVARRRVASASVAIVMIATVTIGAVALTRSKPNRVNIAHSAKDVELTALSRIDATVTLPPDATDQDVAHVEEILVGSDAVVSYAPLPARNLAYLLSFGPDAEMRALRKRVCTERTTLSFAVQLSGTDARAEQDLTGAVGAEATVEPVGTHGAMDLEAFMQVKATAGQVETVAQALAHDSDVSSVRFVNHQGAYDEFKRIFADQPALIENETPAGLPVSFRVTVHDGAKPSDVERRVQDLPGVDLVNTAEDFNPPPDPGHTFDDVCATTSMFQIP